MEFFNQIPLYAAVVTGQVFLRAEIIRPDDDDDHSLSEIRQ